MKFGDDSLVCFQVDCFAESSLSQAASMFKILQKWYMKWVQNHVQIEHSTTAATTTKLAIKRPG